ncbi:MAG: hybrid sensor histidine kinase/response regulator [Anaerolineae bacterium]|jgi:two-component system chemotaxis sensor kinase CheA
MSSLSAKIRQQIINSFRAELAEHIQTMTDGLLALEQGTVSGEQRQSTLDEIFRAAHSLKGAARAVGVTAVEQLAHALEDLLDAIRRDAIEPTPELFTACYQGLDAIQVVQTSFEAGETTPPLEALQALAGLKAFRPSPKKTKPEAHPQETPVPEQEPETPLPEPEPEIPVPEQEVQPQVAPKVEKADAKTPSATVAQQALSRPGERTIRVSVNKLDALMAQLSELLITKIRAEQRLTQILQAQEFMALWQKEWLSARSAYSRLMRKSKELSNALGLPAPSRWPEAPPPGTWSQSSARSLEDNSGVAGLSKDISHLLHYSSISQERLREMQGVVNSLARQYADDTLHMSLVIDDLEHEIKRTRMLPLTTITGTFGRMVRDLAHEASKEARLQIIGGDTELDKRVLEQIKDPLIHLLRNAIDHGVELPAQREAAGKPRCGTITLKAEQLGKNVVISVSDSGAGLDLESVRSAVVRQGEIDAQTLSEEDLKEAIFKVGVSTSPIITDISGRGVGLDVVRRNIEALHGRIDIDSVPEESTTFTLTLPLTLTSSRALLVRASHELFAIPLNSIERILYIHPREVVPLEGHDTIRYNGRPLTLVRLNHVLELEDVVFERDDPRLSVIVLAATERRMAFVVDELAGEQEVVVKGLGKQLSRVGGITGATVMGDGTVVLILNVADLIKLALQGIHRSIFKETEVVSKKVTQARRRILVVDDSITTRTLEKNILEAAGYTVSLATDGQEALNTIAAEGVPDLIVSDVAMPNLNGFELTARIKGDALTANVPVILVTSLDSPADKARGIKVGADAYIIKSGFDQTNLLETIEQLI